MSKSSTMIKITVFLIINIVFLLDKSESIIEEESFLESPSPSPDSVALDDPTLVISSLPKEVYSPQYIKFLKACEQRMTEKCADEIVDDIFKNKKITKRCCSKLVDMGPDCHRTMIQREKELIKGEKEKKRVVSRSEQLWNKCEKLTPPPKNRDYPKLPPREYRPGYEKFLMGCAKKVTEKCGTQIVDAIFGGKKKKKTVDKGCCLKLLKMGNECHVELLKGIQNLAKDNKEREAVKVKGHHIWKHCEEIAGHK